MEVAPHGHAPARSAGKVPVELRALGCDLTCRPSKSVGAAPARLPERRALELHDDCLVCRRDAIGHDESTSGFLRDRHAISRRIDGDSVRFGRSAAR